VTVLDPALTRLADAVLIPPFPGVTAPSWVLEALSRGLAGVTLFGPNVSDGPAALGELTSALCDAAPDALIAIDEEGGDVTRLWYATGSPYPGNAALGVVDDVSLTFSVYASMGRDLAGLGVNLNLAPCLDVLTEPANPVVGTRSFGSDPEVVARHGVAAVRGLQSASVAACVKHFPGHGSTLVDTHESLAVVTGDRAVLASRDLPPFRAAIADGVLAVMPGHLRVPWLTGDLPVSLSAAAIDWLRSSLGFTGVVVSDGIEMRAVSGPFGIPGASVRAVAAGTDLLCLGRDVSEEGYLEVRAALVSAVRSGELAGSRLEEAAARVAELRAQLTSGLVPAGGPRDASGLVPGGAGEPARTGAAPVSGGSDAAGADEVGLEAARRALRLSGTLPVLVNPLVVEIEPIMNMAAGEFHWGLSEWVPPDSVLRVVPDGSADKVVEAAAGRGLVLVYRDAHRSPATQRLLQAVLAERPDAVLVEMGLSYWQPVAKAFLATYGASRASGEAAAELLGLTHGSAARNDGTVPPLHR
jgi:beta-N-acetylhexosaminidase